ncbi:MAG: hypothetical protein DHS20C17_22670 [Cyclobacteriaceae bacterium]|nr:MAG: hypothetical protein DHS20C17_22670 [Cyclobacteriaceae bacterium]
MNRIVLILITALVSQSVIAQSIIDKYGAVTRSDTLERAVYLCFTGHDYYEGFEHVLTVLKRHNIPASFFLTGDFIRNHRNLVKEIVADNHFVGAHSDRHLLYCDWSKRDSLLHSTEEIREDILHNLQTLGDLGISPNYFMPPYEWYNGKVVEIAHQLNQTVVNFSPGTRSNADYTTPDMPNYITSEDILKSIYEYENANGMNGFHLLIHPGTSSQRKDKLYRHLDEIVARLKAQRYHFLKF